MHIKIIYLSPHVRNPGHFGLWNPESTALQFLQIISQSEEYFKPSGMLNLELKVKHKSLILWRRNESETETGQLCSHHLGQVSLISFSDRFRLLITQSQNL